MDEEKEDASVAEASKIVERKRKRHDSLFSSGSESDVEDGQVAGDDISVHSLLSSEPSGMCDRVQPGWVG